MDKYTRIRELGEGSFGNVYLMREKKNGGSLVCVKDIAVNGTASVQDCCNEAKLMEKLSHPNIVAYKDAFMSRNRRHFYIVMDYCSGGDLHAKIQSQRENIQEKRVLLIFVQICLGLHAMHAQGILHRDVKSHNVFISNTGQYVLGDLGIAKELRARDMASTYVGTPFFMAPEQCDGESYTFSADIWALGCLLYELCALKYPFTGATMPALLQNICNAFYDPLPRQYSFELQKLLLKVLSVNANQRPSLLEIISSSLLRPALHCYIVDLRKWASKAHLDAVQAQLKALNLSHLWCDTQEPQKKGLVSFLRSTPEIPTPSYHVEEDLASWLEKERQRHLVLVLEKIKASRFIPQPRPTQPMTMPSTIKRDMTQVIETNEDVEWRPPVQAQPKALPKRNKVKIEIPEFRKGVPLTEHAKPYLAATCKDVRILRQNEYKKAAKARYRHCKNTQRSSEMDECMIATADEINDAIRRLETELTSLQSSYN
ncbi:CAMK family protein kinase [Thraustotheca clavata]|uniref:non-specific serine/threonine protein kinase n=1 Tax=Thraustotheca clavata TaxID=74557 RepID=A0A1W0A1F2_9STRA|nr:CAMK family protein kinase [Thraustotheca clavata]